MGLAMIPFVSRCLGAGDKKQAKYYAKMFILMAMLGLFCTNACLFFTIPYIARLFSLSDTAQGVGQRKTGGPADNAEQREPVHNGNAFSACGCSA